MIEKMGSKHNYKPLQTMNKILIVDASDSDRRLMSGLLVKSGYEPIAVESMEAAKEEVAKTSTRRSHRRELQTPRRLRQRVS